MVKLCGVYEFNKYYKNKKIVCIGAGQQFRNIVNLYEWNIILAIDNDKSKTNTEYKFMDKNILIQDWQYLVRNAKQDWVLLITTKDYDAFLFDIMDESSLASLDIFIWSKFGMFSFDDKRMNFEKKPIIYKQKSEMLIPKVIHFFWFSGESYPDDVKRYMDSWRKYCPEYEIKNWTLDNYSSDNIFFNEAIECKKWAFASDYARADIIYRYGGIYLDSDVELIKNFDDLLYHDAFIGFESDKEVDPGSGFGAQKGNPIIKEFRSIYKDMHFVNYDGSYNMIPCPNYYTKILKRHGLFPNGSYQLLDNIAVYPVTSFCPHSYVSGLMYIEEDTYSIHHHAGSWTSADEKNKIIGRYEEIKKRSIKH